MTIRAANEDITITDLRFELYNYHPGLAQVVWITDKNLVLTTGFSRHSERQFALWSPDDLSRPLKLEARTT